MNRRTFLSTALAAMLAREAKANGNARRPGPDFTPRAKRAIWLCMACAPSQLDLLDDKPQLKARYNEELPDSVRQGQRLTGMSSGQGRFPIIPSRFSFSPAGQSGTRFSELLPWTAKLADDLAVIKSVNTTSINHEPGVMALNTGSEREGRPSLGAWLSYGLGSLSDNLPAFVVLTSTFSSHLNVQAISARLWDSGFLSSAHSGVRMQGVGSPVLYLDNPPGVAATRRQMLDTVNALNGLSFERLGAPDIETRIKQYELAFRMQGAVPELADLSRETMSTRALYGPHVDTPGSFASNCLMARRMLERGVRFVQIYHRGWDAHGKLPENHRAQAGDVDQASYGLVTDLKQRGLLDDTLVIWGGEFGRTVYGQGPASRDDYGRDHHPRCFSIWMAGGGIKGGISYGETDDFSYNVVKDPVPLRDLHATVLHQFGLNHETLAVDLGGLKERLVGVSPPAKVVTGLLR